MMSAVFSRSLLPPVGRRLAVLAVLAATAACSGAPRAQDADSPARARAAATDTATDGAGMRTPYGDFLAARHAERIHNAARAADLFARTLASSPNDPALMRQTMNQMFAAGRLDEGAAIARRYIAHEPESVLANLALAVVELARRDPSAAEAHLAKIPSRGLGSYFAPLTTSWVRAAQGDTDGALKRLESLSKLRGGPVFHDYHAALILDLAGDSMRAGQFFDKLSKDGYSGYVRFVEAAGAYLERSGQAAKAQDIYSAYLERRPDATPIEAALARAMAGAPAARPVADPYEGAAEALYNLATLLNQENVPEIGMMVLQMALKVRPKFDSARLLEGDILAATNRDEDAIAAYDKVTRDGPLGWPARLRAAQLLDRSGKTEVAIARLSDMGREQPARHDALVALGDILRFKKRYPDAVDAYDAAFKRIGAPDKRHWSLFYARAIALERAKKWDRAEADFLKALEFQPDQPLVLNYLGYSWVEQGRHLDRALGMLEKAVKLRPTDGFIVDSLGWAHYQLKNYARAVTYLERAAELTSQDPTINDHLGDAYWQVGRRHEARFQWSRALGLEPEQEDIPKIRKKLAEGLPGTTKRSEAAPPARDRSGG